MSRSPLPRGLKRALDLLDAESARWRTTTALAAACGVATRTLQRHFRRFLGSAPMRVQRAFRFDQARAELLQAKPGTTVTEIAMRCGFTHLGRFSLRYRERYGESPSATLRRRQRDDAPAFAERVAVGIAHAIGRSSQAGEIDHAWLSARELTLRALPCALSFEPASVSLALEFLEQAMELAPRDALPAALASWCHGLRAGHHFTSRPDEDRRAARALAARAAQLDNCGGLAQTLLAAGYTLAHDLSSAARHIERALVLDGSSAWAWGRSGWIKTYCGEPEAAVERFRIARTLAPGDPLSFLCAIGIGAAHFEAARYGEAVRWFRQGRTERPTAIWNNRFLAPACALAGRKDEARKVLAELYCAYPDLSITQVRSGLPYSPSFLDRAAEGLESAGMRP